MEHFHLSPDSSVIYYPCFFSLQESTTLFESLTHQIPWQQTKIIIFGKPITEPRLVSFHGDEGIKYKYSGKINSALPWNTDLKFIRSKIHSILNQPVLPNSALLNYYRNGQDHMGWHSDNEPELGINPTIYSVSFGEERKMSFRCKKKKSKSILDIKIQKGSLLIMKGTTQHEFQHCIRKTAKEISSRINITFRKIC